MESCGFRDRAEAFAKKGYVLFGASKDTPETLAKFKAKHKLGYQMLSDPKGELAKLFGFRLGKRRTVVIGADGAIKKLYPKVSIFGHPKKVLAELDKKKK